MFFYAVKEVGHCAIFDSRDKAEDFKKYIKSRSQICSFDDIKLTIKYLNWNKHNTKVFVVNNINAIYENKQDINENGRKKVFNNPYNASAYLNWGNKDEYIEQNTLGKSNAFIKLSDYTVLLCKRQLKMPLSYKCFYYLCIAYMIILLAFYSNSIFDLGCKSSVVILCAWVLAVGFIILDVIYIKKNNYTFTLHICLKQLSQKIYLEIKKYKFSSTSLVELIKETEEINKSSRKKILNNELLRKIVNLVYPLLPIPFLKNYFTNSIKKAPLAIIKWFTFIIILFIICSAIYLSLIHI